MALTPENKALNAVKDTTDEMIAHTEAEGLYKLYLRAKVKEVAEKVVAASALGLSIAAIIEMMD